MKIPNYIDDDHVTMFLVFVSITTGFLSFSIGGNGWYVVTLIFLGSVMTLAKRHHESMLDEYDDGDDDDGDDDDGGTAFVFQNEALMILADAFEPVARVEDVVIDNPVSRHVATHEGAGENEEQGEDERVGIVQALLTVNEYHLLITGGSRIGKTTLSQHVVDERLKAGHRVIVVDPHNYPADWPNCDFRKAHRDGEAYLTALNEILDIAEERYEDASIERSPITLFISEWYAFLKSSKVSKETSKAAIAALQEVIATVGKAGLCVICDTHSETKEGLGFDAADLKDCFASCRLTREKGVRRYEIDDVEYGDCGPFLAFSPLRTVLRTKNGSENSSENGFQNGSEVRTKNGSDRSDVEEPKWIIDQDGRRWKVLLQDETVLTQSNLDSEKVLSRPVVETGPLGALTSDELELIKDGLIHELSFSQIVKSLPRPKSEYKSTSKLVRAQLANAIGA